MKHVYEYKCESMNYSFEHYEGLKLIFKPGDDSDWSTHQSSDQWALGLILKVM